MDSVFLEGARAAAVTAKPTVSGVKAKPSVAGSRKLILMSGLDKIDS